MTRRLVQIMGDGIEELWYFDIAKTDSQIRKFYENYINSDFESFEDYMEALEEDAERVFVDEIYIKTEVSHE